MSQTMQGTVRGNTIEFDEQIGLQDGQKVEVSLRAIGLSQQKEPWGEGLKQCAGALAGMPGLDEDLREILRARKTAKIREGPE